VGCAAHQHGNAYQSVTRVLNECFKSGTRVLSECYKSGTRVLYIYVISSVGPGKTRPHANGNRHCAFLKTDTHTHTHTHARTHTHAGDLGVLQEGEGGGVRRLGLATVTLQGQTASGEPAAGVRDALLYCSVLELFCLLIRLSMCPSICLSVC
jgi:hypothetical protein